MLEVYSNLFKVQNWDYFDLFNLDLWNYLIEMQSQRPELRTKEQKSSRFRTFCSLSRIFCWLFCITEDFAFHTSLAIILLYFLRERWTNDRRVFGKPSVGYSSMTELANYAKAILKCLANLDWVEVSRTISRECLILDFVSRRSRRRTFRGTGDRGLWRGRYMRVNAAVRCRALYERRIIANAAIVGLWLLIWMLEHYLMSWQKRSPGDNQIT